MQLYVVVNVIFYDVVKMHLRFRIWKQVQISNISLLFKYFQDNIEQWWITFYKVNRCLGLINSADTAFETVY